GFGMDAAAGGRGCTGGRPSTGSYAMAASGARGNVRAAEFPASAAAHWFSSEEGAVGVLARLGCLFTSCALPGVSGGEASLADFVYGGKSGNSFRLIRGGIEGGDSWKSAGLGGAV